MSAPAKPVFYSLSLSLLCFNCNQMFIQEMWSFFGLTFLFCLTGLFSKGFSWCTLSTRMRQSTLARYSITLHQWPLSGEPSANQKQRNNGYSVTIRDTVCLRLGWRLFAFLCLLVGCSRGLRHYVFGLSIHLSVRPPRSSESDISEKPWGNFLKFGLWPHQTHFWP